MLDRCHSRIEPRSPNQERASKYYVTFEQGGTINSLLAFLPIFRFDFLNVLESRMFSMINLYALYTCQFVILYRPTLHIHMTHKCIVMICNKLMKLNLGVRELLVAHGISYQFPQKTGIPFYSFPYSSRMGIYTSPAVCWPEYFSISCSYVGNSQTLGGSFCPVPIDDKQVKSDV